MGDLHVSKDSRGNIRPALVDLPERADVLLLAGDLTHHGGPQEGELLAEELRDLGLPTVAVFGNHDYHQNAQQTIRQSLERVGVVVLEAESTVLTLGQLRVGIAGAKGFGGGFTGSCGSEFGEPEMKAFIGHTKRVARSLHEVLMQLDCNLRIALTHYAPSNRTLAGEKLEIYPFLGSYLLGEAIDDAQCDLAVHGHAHRGTERGVTPGGVPVRNVARPVIRRAYRVYQLHGHRTPAV